MKIAKPTEMPGAVIYITQVHDRVHRVGKVGGRYSISPWSVNVY